MFDRRLISGFDWTLFVVSLTLSALGIANLYSAGSLVYSQVYTVPGYSEMTPPIDLKTVSPTAETGVIVYHNLNLKFRFTSVNTGGGIAEFELGGSLFERLPRRRARCLFPEKRH